MVVFNYSSRELTTKIVYYGPGLCGKTTNLQFIYDNMPQGVRGKMLSLATKSDRTLFFDFLPIDLGQIQGMKTKVQLYTVPGQVFYNETRRLVLKGADGVVFVADSQENMLEANLDSLRNLEENLVAHGMDPSTTPIVLQYNKRDLPNAMTLEQLNESLNRFNAPFYEAIATTGVGVQETLRHITKLVLLSLNERFGSDRRRATPNVPPQAAAPVSSEIAPSVSAAALVDVPTIAPPSRAPVETPTIVAPVMPAAVAAASHASETDVDSAFGALMDDQEAELAFGKL
ncbi:MAG: GTPase domain-containing protein [Acidobacteria bacterium]|nr:GTPase domain-containing protein [Acidobacteriota bacterium]